MRSVIFLFSLYPKSKSFSWKYKIFWSNDRVKYRLWKIRALKRNGAQIVQEQHHIWSQLKISILQTIQIFSTGQIALAIIDASKTTSLDLVLVAVHLLRTSFKLHSHSITKSCPMRTSLQSRSEMAKLDGCKLSKPMHLAF